MTILDDIWSAGSDVLDFGDKILKEFGSAAKDLGRGVYRITAGTTDIFVSGGKVIIDTFDDIQTAFSNLLRGAIGIRPLRSNEIATADKLFRGAVPYSKVVVVSMEGIGGKPFTVPANMFGHIHQYFFAPTALLNFLVASLRLQGKYLMFMGKAGYQDALNYYADRGRFDRTTNMSGRTTGQYLCHELTHVWQGEYQDNYSYQYVINSVGHQIVGKITGESAYNSTAGKHWRDYEIEQQGSLIDNFWKDTSSMNLISTEQDPSWPYIRDVIRPRNPKADYRAIVLAKPTVNRKMTQAEADALLQQAAALKRQGQVMVMTGHPALVAQGQAYISTAAQIEAAVVAAGFPITRISGMATMAPSTMGLSPKPGSFGLPSGGAIKLPPGFKR